MVAPNARRNTRSQRTWCYGSAWGDAESWTGRRLLQGTVEAANPRHGARPEKPLLGQRVHPAGSGDVFELEPGEVIERVKGVGAQREL